MQKFMLSFVSRTAIVFAALFATWTLMTVKPASADHLVMASPSAIPFIPYADTWPSAQNRWWDIASYKSGITSKYNQYNGWGLSDPNPNQSGDECTSSVFKYGTSGTVTVTYDKTPLVPYFVAHIVADNLKPNFAYQVKLTGKPVSGTSRLTTDNIQTKGRGWGPFSKKDNAGNIVTVPDGGGEDWANERLGYAGRWWNDSAQGSNTNATTDSVYEQKYITEGDTVYGYQFMGVFVTDANGDANVNMTGQYSYHITRQANWETGWQVEMVQDGYPAQVNGAFVIKGSPENGDSYAYGSVQPSSGVVEKNGYPTVKLGYEYERSSSPVVLPPGKYRCRIMLTEESFHNNYGTTSGDFGGKWKSVLITEDYNKGADGKTTYTNNIATPDVDPNNDIVFTIGDVSVLTPGTPTGVTANRSTTDPTQVTVSWTALAGTTSNSNYYYKIKRSQNSGGPYTTIAGGAHTKAPRLGSAPSFIDKTATSGVTYYYLVSAVNSGVEGLDSLEASTTAPTTAPILTATPGDTQVTLSWNKIAGATSYSLKRGTASGSYNTTIVVPAPGNATTVTYADTGLTNQTEYFYIVSAVNTAGTGPISNEVSAIPGPPAPPTLSPAVAYSTSIVGLKWTDNSKNEQGFIIERSLTTTGSFTEIGRVVANVASFCDGATGGPYYYRVIAYNAVGESISDYVTTTGSLAAPEAPTNLTAIAGDSKVTLNWIGNCGAFSYNVYRALLNGEFKLIGSAPGTTYIDTPLENGLTYYYKVTAVNDSLNESATKSNEAIATPQGPPPAPTDLTASAAAGQITLNWAASSGATSYAIYRATTAGGQGSTPLAASLTTTSYTDKAVTNGITYFYKVAAVNQAGESAQSAEVSAIPIVASAATPLITPDGGAFFGKATVTLSTTTPGATLYYTTNGSSWTPYTGTITLTASATLTAKAVASGYTDSAVASATFNVQNSVSLNPTADAHVRGGNNATTNYGSATSWEVKTSTSTKENRDAYLKFDLNSLGTVGSLSSVKLRFYGHLSANGTVTTTLYGVSNTTWTETGSNGINWNNKPPLGSVLGTKAVTGTTYAWYELDVTAYIQQELNAGQRVISLALHNVANSNPNIQANSRESATNKPVLLVSG